MSPKYISLAKFRALSLITVALFALLLVFAENTVAQERKSDTEDTTVETKRPVSIVIEEGRSTQKILIGAIKGSKIKALPETSISEQQIDVQSEDNAEGAGDLTFTIINGGGSFAKSGGPVVTVPLEKELIYLPEIAAAKSGDEGIIRINVNGRQVYDDIRVATVSKTDLELARGYFPFGSRSVIGQNTGYMIVDENKVENVSQDTVTQIFSEDGKETFDEGLCIRTPFGPGKVNYNGFSPWAVGKRYSYKPESSGTLSRGSGTSDNVDAVYRYSWGCGTALKVPDSCTLTINNDGSLNTCCNAAMAALGHTVKWVNPTSHGFPRCPLAP